MNWNPKQSAWKQLTHDIKRRWEKLIDNQLDLWTGKRDHPIQVAASKARQQKSNHPSSKLPISYRSTGDQP